MRGEDKKRMGRVTLKDVAEQAGVAVSTASLILNNHPLPFRESTKKKVQEVAAALGYRPHAMAKQLSQSGTRNNAIGFLVQHETPSRMGNAPVYEFMCGVNDVLLDRDHFMVTLQMGQLLPGDQVEPRLISESFVDGLIIEAGLELPLRDRVERYKLPLVHLNSLRHDSHDCVWPDEIHASATVTNHVIGMGHRRILYVTPASIDAGHYSNHERAQGYRTAMEQSGLSPEFRVTGDSAGDGTAGVVSEIERSHSEGEPVTAVVTSVFSSALELRYALSKIGVACPQDLSLATVEDLHMFRRPWPDITGITCDRYAMGRQAAEILLRKIESGGKPHPSFEYRGEIIPGATVGPPK
jgi:LacI family transcriptional regulator